MNLRLDDGAGSVFATVLVRSWTLHAVAVTADTAFATVSSVLYL